jgi:ribosomal protein S27E
MFPVIAELRTVRRGRYLMAAECPEHCAEDACVYKGTTGTFKCNSCVDGFVPSRGGDLCGKFCLRLEGLSGLCWEEMEPEGPPSSMHFCTDIVAQATSRFEQTSQKLFNQKICSRKCSKPKHVTLNQRLTQWISVDLTYNHQLDKLKPITKP